MSHIGVIDLGFGNVLSVVNMLRRCGANVRIITEPRDSNGASHLVLTGVGSFSACVDVLHATSWYETLQDLRQSGNSHILGICLGMQMMTESSGEGPGRGLGWFRGTTQPLQTQVEMGLPVPHMGWNSVCWAPECAAEMPVDSRFYFAHSYSVHCDVSSDVMGTTLYGVPVVAAVKSENCIGVQFHPEKSHVYGQSFLTWFADLKC